MNKDLRKLIREYQHRGWIVRKTGGNHYLWIAPDGHRVYSAATPGDRRTFANIKSDLRRIAV